MTTLTQHAAPEDLMALHDNELPAAEAESLRTHIADCPQCAAQLEAFEALSQTLGTWTVPAAPDPSITALPSSSRQPALSATVRKLRKSRSPWQTWTIATAGAFAAFAIVVALTPAMHRSNEGIARTESYMQLQKLAVAPSQPVATAPAPPPPPPPQSDRYAYDLLPDAPATDSKDELASAGSKVDKLQKSRNRTQTLDNSDALVEAASSKVPPSPRPAAINLIARSATLNITVPQFAPGRSAVESIVKAHGGYFSSFDVTAAGSSHVLGASLRVPSAELDATLRQLRTLGRVEHETQTGEDVTAQHADLAARLTNARETEARLRGILAERTGRVSDVLEVEEQISSTREEIETMEAEQQSLEHRVSYSSIDLTLTEETHTQPEASVGTRLREAFTNGLHAVGASILSLLLFLEEDGPTILFWLALLGIPAWLLLRRYRRLRRTQ